MVSIKLYFEEGLYEKITSILLAIYVIVSLVSCGGDVTDKLQEKLDLGQKYLAEEDYENALIAFETAIEIDEKSVEAYIGAADAYIGMGEPEKAMEILNIGFEKIDDESLQKKHDTISETILPKEKREALLPLIELSKLEDIDSIRPILESINYAEISKWMKNNNTDRYIFGENPNRIGLYLADNNIMVYVGEYSGDERSGQGTWMISGYYASGEWSNDMPNGSQKVMYTYGYRTGNMVDGLWNGTVIFSDTEVGEVWSFNYSNGIVHIIENMEDHGITDHPYRVGENQFKDENYFHYNEEEVNSTHGMMGFAERE